MKSLLVSLLRWPFRKMRTFLKVRDTLFVHSAEHLFRTTKFIRSHIRFTADEKIVDIGAADGGTALWFAKQFPAQPVVAFEPVTSSFQQAVARTRHLSHVKIHQVALSDREGETQVHITSDPLASSLIAPSTSGQDMPASHAAKFKVISSQSVKSTTLDNFLNAGDRILLMKIDTQGTELPILKGAVRSLAGTRLVLVEMNNHDTYKGSGRYYEVDEFLRSRGFRLVDIYVTYRPKERMQEFDALYENAGL